VLTRDERRCHVVLGADGQVRDSAEANDVVVQVAGDFEVDLSGVTERRLRAAEAFDDAAPSSASANAYTSEVTVPPHAANVLVMNSRSARWSSTRGYRSTPR